MKPGALFQGTMLTTRNSNYGVGRAIAPDTFVIDGQEEKGTRIFTAMPPV